jgi:hypothetical protein
MKPLKARSYPDRLSFTHALRICAANWPPAQLSPSQHRQLFFNALFAEMLQDRCVSSRGRSVPRGVKRKMGHYPIRHPIPLPKYPLRRAAVILLAILR